MGCAGWSSSLAAQHKHYLWDTLGGDSVPVTNMVQVELKRGKPLPRSVARNSTTDSCSRRNAAGVQCAPSNGSNTNTGSTGRACAAAAASAGWSCVRRSPARIQMMCGASVAAAAGAAAAAAGRDDLHRVVEEECLLGRELIRPFNASCGRRHLMAAAAQTVGLAVAILTFFARACLCGGCVARPYHRARALLQGWEEIFLS